MTFPRQLVRIKFNGESGTFGTGSPHPCAFGASCVRVRPVPLTPRTCLCLFVLHDSPDADAGVISAKTFNGTSITMGLSLQYRLKRTASSVFSTYMKYGEDYHKFYAKVR